MTGGHRERPPVAASCVAPGKSGHLCCTGEDGCRATSDSGEDDNPNWEEAEARYGHVLRRDGPCLRALCGGAPTFPRHLSPPILPENAPPRPPRSPHLSPSSSHHPAAPRRPSPPPHRPPIARRRVAMASFLKAFKYAHFLSASLPLLDPSHSASLVRRPMFTQCASSAVMFGVGDILAQQAFEKKGTKHDVRPPPSLPALAQAPTWGPPLTPTPLAVPPHSPHRLLRRRPLRAPPHKMARAPPAPPRPEPRPRGRLQGLARPDRLYPRSVIALG